MAGRGGPWGGSGGEEEGIAGVTPEGVKKTFQDGIVIDFNFVFIDHPVHLRVPLCDHVLYIVLAYILFLNDIEHVASLYLSLSFFSSTIFYH